MHIQEAKSHIIIGYIKVAVSIDFHVFIIFKKMIKMFENGQNAAIILNDVSNRSFIVFKADSLGYIALHPVR